MHRATHSRLPRLIGLALFIVCLSGCQKTHPEASGESAIQGTLEQYAASIDSASAEAARHVWSQRNDASFVHPLGHERGFDQIKSNFYEKLMSGMFSARKFTIKNVKVAPLGDAALVTFYWDFDAKWKKDGSTLKTTGRETQVLVREVGGAWKLLHAHYSGMPVANLNQGFQRKAHNVGVAAGDWTASRRRTSRAPGRIMRFPSPSHDLAVA